MLFDESYEQLRKQSFFHLRFFFLILMISSHQPCEWNVITPAICIYVCLSGKVSFHFLNFVFISHAIRHQYKRHVLFPKGELFVLFNFCIFHEWNWLYYFTKQKIWRSWYLTYWSNAYVIEWNRKIFYRLKNKAFCKRLKRWVEFLFFAQIYAVLNQKMFFSK